MKKILLILVCWFLIGVISCKKNNDQTLTLTDTPQQVKQCAESVVEYLKPDRYAYGYTLMEGKLNLTIDFVCRIDIYYAKDKYNYYSEYICYIIDDKVELEEIYYERV